MEEIGKSGKEGSLTLVFLVMLLSIAVVSFWDSIPAIKNSVNAVLNPTAGALLGWNLTLGMTIIVLILSLITSLVQKYATDQKTMRELKEEQKKLNEEAKKFSHDPQKMMEFNKKVFPLTFRMMRLSMRSIIYTAIPLILLFRWFMDYFETVEFKFWIFSWFWFYLVVTIIFSSILRKVLKVV